MTKQRNDAIQQVFFSDLDLKDPFFDSLRTAYDGFDDWMLWKGASGEQAWASFEDNGSISSMLYLKPESDVDETAVPRLTENRLKIGTFKVDFDHHTSIGNRLLAIALRQFARGGYRYAYLTMYDSPNTDALRQRLGKYGFVHTGSEGKEELWTKSRPRPEQTDPYLIFPFLLQRHIRAMI